MNRSLAAIITAAVTTLTGVVTAAPATADVLSRRCDPAYAAAATNICLASKGSANGSGWDLDKVTIFANGDVSRLEANGCAYTVALTRFNADGPYIAWQESGVLTRANDYDQDRGVGKTVASSRPFYTLDYTCWFDSGATRDGTFVIDIA